MVVAARVAFLLQRVPTPARHRPAVRLSHRQDFNNLAPQRSGWVSGLMGGIGGFLLGGLLGSMLFGGMGAWAAWEVGSSVVLGSWRSCSSLASSISCMPICGGASGQRLHRRMGIHRRKNPTAVAGNQGRRRRPWTCQMPRVISSVASGTSARWMPASIHAVSRYRVRSVLQGAGRLDGAGYDPGA